MANLTPGAWLSRLEEGLTAQQTAIKEPEDYYAGRHRLAFATQKFRQTFGALFRALADNWCRTVVDAPVERLVIEGFRFGPDQEADKEAWSIWQANCLDAESVIAHTEAVKDGAAYVMVSPPEAGSDVPIITVEHPSQVIVAFAPGSRRQRLAALKRWADEDGYWYANLYLPTAIYKWRTENPQKSGSPDGRNWVAAEGSGGENPLRVVPIVPLLNNPTMMGGGQSDLLSAIPLQDAINKEIADMLIASEFAAFPQRVAMGIEVPTGDDGLPLPQVELKAAVSRFWAFESKDAKIGEFSAADLNNYVQAVTMLLQHLAAQTRTPPHYLLGQIVNASGDALKAAETGLVAKVRRKQLDFAEGWEEALRLAFKLRGDTQRAEETAAEVIWRDPEYRSQGEMVDALVKLGSLGVPAEVLWEKAGFTPQEIDRMKAMQEAESLLQAALVGQRRITVTESASDTTGGAAVDQPAVAPPKQDGEVPVAPHTRSLPSGAGT
jgi:hypothetical protein